MKTKQGNSAIYGIRSKHDSKLYVGQTTRLSERHNEHLYELRRNVHPNDHLQRVFNKYGDDNFEFFVIEYCSKKQLNDREKHWISFYNTMDKNFGYNKTSGGDSFEFNDEIKKKMSMARMGEKNPNYGTTKYRGTGHGNAIYTEEQVIKAIELLKQGVIVRIVAEKTGISQRSVRAIKVGQAWVHLTGGRIGIDTNLGASNGNAKLTVKQVLEIVELLKKGIQQKVIAELYSVNPKTISQIANGDIWSHATKGHLEGIPKNRKPSSTILDESQVIEIVHLILNTNLTLREIADKYGVAESVIGEINRGNSWKSITGGKRLRINPNTGSKTKRKTTLLEEQVREIIELIKSGYVVADIAKQFGVSDSTIGKIKNGQSWLDITHGPVEVEVPEYPPIVIKEIIECLRYSDYTIDEIVNKFGVSAYLVRGINEGTFYAEISGGRIREKGPRKGSGNGMSTISEEKAMEIVNDLLEQLDIFSIVKKRKVNKRIVLNIKNKKLWKHLTKDIEFSY